MARDLRTRLWQSLREIDGFTKNAFSFELGDG